MPAAPAPAPVEVAEPHDETECLLRQGQNLVGVAELLVAGKLLGWPRLQIAPHMAIQHGEPNWVKFLEFPPARAVEAALEATKPLIEERWPF